MQKTLQQLFCGQWRQNGTKLKMPFIVLLWNYACIFLMVTGKFGMVLNFDICCLCYSHNITCGSFFTKIFCVFFVHNYFDFGKAFTIRLLKYEYVKIQLYLKLWKCSFFAEKEHFYIILCVNPVSHLIHFIFTLNSLYSKVSTNSTASMAL